MIQKKGIMTLISLWSVLRNAYLAYSDWLICSRIYIQCSAQLKMHHRDVIIPLFIMIYCIYM